MSVISEATMRFLADLRANNSREWFTANKPRYETANAEFHAFVDSVIERVALFDPDMARCSAKNAVFRIYRDVRFSRDKSPYKPHFGALLSPVAEKSRMHTQAGYYIHLEPGAVMLAGGAYQPDGPWLRAIREKIASAPTKWNEIIGEREFRRVFGAIEGESLKKVPAGFAADHPLADTLKLKSFIASYKPPDEIVVKPDFARRAAKIFEIMAPLARYLNAARTDTDAFPGGAGRL